MPQEDDVIEAIRAGKYETAVPMSIEPLILDKDEMTGRQVREMQEAHRLRQLEQREAYRADRARLRDLFKADLEAEHGVVGHPKADKLFDLAWEYGHSDGHESVAYHYGELMGLVS